MNTKITVFTIIFTLFCNVLLFAQDTTGAGTNPAAADNTNVSGPTDITGKQPTAGYKSVNGLENWNHTFDITGYKKGIYNIIIRGTDKAGNIYYEGPFNIYVDPESDLPVVNISNPNMSMRVGGNMLNIVGTCVDDDAVASVEIRIDDGLFRKAGGTDFWSYSLNTADMIDGLHAVTARGIDINGVTGKAMTVNFHLDRKKPFNAVTSHKDGVLLSGKINLEGYTEDLNGIDKLYLSKDNGLTFELLPTRFDKKENKNFFKLGIETKKLKDGPQVYWFKGIDKTGSVGLAAFLFFVDNTNPVIEILDPKLKPDEGAKQTTVNGLFSVSGKVSDELGIKSLRYAYEKEKGEIPLIPGNPYWIKDFDFTGVKGSKAAITFTVEDITGNILNKKFEFPVDREADLPVVEITFPIPEAVIEGDVIVSGFITDDDGAAEIRYSIDKESPVALKTTEAFSFLLDTLAPGKHNLTLYGVDINGTEGKKIAVDFFKAGAPALITLTKAVQKTGEQDFFPGIELQRDSNPVLAGEIQMADAVKTAEYSLKTAAPVKLTIKTTNPEGKKLFEIPIPPAVPFGVVNISVKIVDVYDRVHIYTSFVYITNYTKINDEPGIYLTDRRITADNTITITKENPFSFLFVGDDIKALAFEPETGIVTLTNQHNLVIVKTAREGCSAPVNIVLTTIYDEVFKTQSLRFINDNTPPVLTVNTPQTGDWFQGEVEVAGKLEDVSGIQSLKYSADNLKTFTDIPFTEEAGTLVFSRKLNLSGKTDGNVSLFLEATDKAGNSALKAIALNKDSANPKITLFTLQSADAIAAKVITVLAGVSDNGVVDTVEFSTDATDYINVPGEKLYKYDLNLEQTEVLPEKIYIRVTDKSRNVQNLTSLMLYDKAAITMGKLRTAEVDYKKDESYFTPGTASLALKGNDATGGISYLGSFFPGNSADAAPPRDKITSYDQAMLVAGVLKLSGTIENAEEITELFVSGDNGDNYEKLKFAYNKKTKLYTFSMNIKTMDMADGPAVYWFKTIHAAGSVSHAPFLFIVDNTRPEIMVYTPGEVKAVNGKVTAGGSVKDANGIKSFVYSMEKTKEELPLTAGNPYWVKEWDFTASKAKTVQIVFTAVDFAGNTNTYTLKLTIDPKSDMPVTGIVYPEPGAIINTSVIPVTGFAWDDETVTEIKYSLDGKEARTLKTNEAFSFELKDLSRGKHALSVSAVDVNGVEGAPSRVDFTVTGPSPGVLIKSAQSGADASAFTPGLLINAAAGTASLEGECTDNVQGAEYSLNNGVFEKIAVKTDKATGIKSFSIPVKKELPFGRVNFRIKVADEYAREAEFTSFFYKTDAAVEGGTEDQEQFYFTDTRIDAAGNIRLQKDVPLQGLFNGREIASITLVPLQDTVAVSNNGSLVTVKALKEGISGLTRIRVETVNKRVFDSQEFRFYTDVEKPAITVTAPHTEDWINSSFLLEGTAWDNTGLKSLELSFDLGETFRSVKTGAAENGYAFSENISINHLADGPVTLILKASDESGNTHAEIIALKKDTQKPAVSLITPPAADIINGMITVIGAAEDAGEVKVVEFCPDGENYIKVTGTKRFSHTIDFSAFAALPEKFLFRVTDKSQNSTLFEPVFNFDFEADKPVVQIQIPEEGATLKNDFIISGMVFDDDGIQAIDYRIDSGEFIRLDGSNNFVIPVSLEAITDNEHLIEVQAEDIGGLKGEIKSRHFQISKAEPVSKLLTPQIDRTVQGEIVLTGSSSDANGIKQVYVSYDNLNTYNLARGKEDWKYPLDTRILEDGVHRIFIKAVDNTDTEGVYSTLINIDNTPPEIYVDKPKDGDKIANIITLDGRAFDNLVLNTLEFSLSPIAGEGGGAGKTISRELPLTGVFSKDFDLSGFAPGWYNLTIKATDKADNISYLARNILVQEKQVIDKIDIIFPGSGEKAAGFFTIDGRVFSEEPVNNVVVLLNGAALKVIPVNKTGNFSVTVGPDELTDGDFELEVQANVSKEKVIKSEQRSITYTREGCWVTINNLSTGDFITERPWLTGEAGCYLQPPNPDDKDAVQAYKQKQKELAVRFVEISLDNGKSFNKVTGRNQWKFRLETQWMPDGEAHILVRAVFNGGMAVTKRILIVDDKPPVVTLLNLEEGARFNDKIEVLGNAADDNGLTDVSINLRKGDKGGYDVPQFIEGLYIEGTALGHTYGTAGFGLTFFDEVVKFQLYGGIAPDKRISGINVGIKVLANILSLPFDYFFGPDWEFLSVQGALGASFSYYSNTGTELIFPGENGKLLGSFLTQLELKFRFKKLSFFSTYSLFSELAVALIPSDVPDAATLEPKVGFGLRIGVF